VETIPKQHAAWLADLDRLDDLEAQIG
jgi:hypothetical protein